MDAVLRCLDCVTDPAETALAVTEVAVIGVTCPTCGGTNITYIGPVQQRPEFQGIGFTNCIDTVTSGATIMNIDGPAIALDGGSGHTVTDNTLINTEGIRITDADFDEVSGNELLAEDDNPDEQDPDE